MATEAETCTCGGAKTRTGGEVLEEERLTGLGDGPDDGDRVISREYKCASCGQLSWQTFTEKAPPRRVE